MWWSRKALSLQQKVRRLALAQTLLVALCHRQMNKPRRIQLRRTKGFKLPPNTISVARPSRWGNPFIIGNDFRGMPINRSKAVALFEKSLTLEERVAAKAELKGKNLACYCPLDGGPCHADVLLKIANS